MATWDKEIDFNFRGWLVLALFAAAIAIAWVILLGTRARSEPTRCSAGFETQKARCCAPGQAFSAGYCVGKPESCPAPFVPAGGSDPGCALPEQKIHIAGGSVTLGPTDWDSADIVERYIVSVQDFLIDQSEVSNYRYLGCIEAGLCPARTLGPEPGAPVTFIGEKEAQTFCAFAGGRLPTPAEWIYAASGSEARRYPWGAHGLVCRRAVFGLSEGPCSHGATQPEITGMRSDGKTPQGLLDMAGNVAEWAITADGVATVHGGSFRSRVAGELKVWSQGSARESDDVGFRCVYPADRQKNP